MRKEGGIAEKMFLSFSDNTSFLYVYDFSFSCSLGSPEAYMSIPLGFTGVENTIWVSVLPYFCSGPIKESNSIVLGNATLISME